MLTLLKHVVLCVLLAWDASPAVAALQALVSNTEKLIIGVANEMPADKYDFVPSGGEFRGVRTFGKQLKHAAAVQYLVANSILGDPVTAEMSDERGPDQVRAKTGVFGSAPTTRTSLVAGALAHTSNHYGQVVEYLRMNGIIPPASRILNP